jgi:hypothetical protein
LKNFARRLAKNSSGEARRRADNPQTGGETHRNARGMMQTTAPSSPAIRYPSTMAAFARKVPAPSENRGLGFSGADLDSRVYCQRSFFDHCMPDRNDADLIPLVPIFIGPLAFPRTPSAAA